MDYGVQRPTIAETRENAGMVGWFQSLWRWILAQTRTVTVTTTYTVEWDRHFVRADATSAPFTATLPTAVGNHGRKIVVKKIDSSANVVTVGVTGSETIDGASSVTLVNQYDTVIVISNDSNWEKVAQGIDADLTALATISGTGYVVKSGTATYVTRSLTQPAAGITISNSDGVSGNSTFALANDLSALEGLASTGIAVRSASDTWVQRSLANAAAGITWTNGDGVAGNPTPVLANDLLALEGLASTGIAVRSAVDTWIQRSLAQPAAGITISNSDGVAGNPTFALANDLSAVEGLSGTGLAVRTTTDTWTNRTITGTASQITVSNGDGVSGNPTLSLTAGNLVQGTYTPTLTAVANVSGTPTAYSCQYIQVGTTVTVSGRADVQPTTATVATQLGISLPVASNLANANECAGSFWAGNAFTGGVILGDAVNNRAEANWIAGDTTSRPFYFTFTYRII